MRVRNAAVIAAAASVSLLASCGLHAFPAPVDALPPAEPDIDLSAYELTFEETFEKKLSVSGRRCDTRWIAHTPWNGDFGAAAFVDPSRNFPFRTRNGLLRIEAKKDRDFGWLSGLLSGYNTCGQGFAQQYGYFEIRAMLPEGDGFWPAFWLIGVEQERYTAEIDVFEQHGMRPDQFESTIHVHVRPETEGVERINRSYTHQVPARALSRGFNTYGVSVDEEFIIFFFNRREIWRTPTPEEHKQPFYVLLNLAMDHGEITARTPKQAFMYVDYVRVWARPETGPPAE